MGILGTDKDVPTFVFFSALRTPRGRTGIVKIGIPIKVGKKSPIWLLGSEDVQLFLRFKIFVLL